MISIIHRRHNQPPLKSAFTLVELLIVIIIVAILAAIAIPLFLNQQRGARDASVQSDLNGAAQAVETYNATNGAYPTAAQVNDTDIQVTAGNFVFYTAPSGSTSYLIYGCNAQNGTWFVWNPTTGGLADDTRTTTCDASASGVGTQVS